jgi:hypothetical protein
MADAPSQHLSKPRLDPNAEPRYAGSVGRAQEVL